MGIIHKPPLQTPIHGKNIFRKTSPWCQKMLRSTGLHEAQLECYAFCGFGQMYNDAEPLVGCHRVVFLI